MKTTSADSFVTECRIALESLQLDVATLIASSPQPVQRATDLQASLSIRAPLAWQMFRLANAEAPMETVLHIPLADAMEKVLEAAHRRGFCQGAIRATATSYAKFNEMVALHAGDRATFDGMVSGLITGASEQIDLKVRRAAFRANSQLWGMRAQTTYRCLIGAWDTAPDSAPSVIIQGTRKVRALRPNQSLPICRRTVTVTSYGDSVDRTPSSTNAEILRDFCSPELPRIVSKIKGSVAHDFLTFNAVGLTAELDVFVSTRLRSGMNSSEPEMGVTSMVRLPSEEFIADLLVPAGVMDPKTARLRVCGCLEDVSAAETGPAEYVVPSDHQVEYLGRNIAALQTETIPFCADMIRYILRDTGQNRAEFDIFRCRIPYPTLHMCIGLSVTRLK